MIDEAALNVRPIVGLEGRYCVTSNGRVVNPRTGLALRPFVIKQGYLTVTLWAGRGKRRRHLVHRLVAVAFLPPAPPKTPVNHMDGVKTNNAVANLEWTTAAENNRHARRLGLNNTSPIVRRGDDHPRCTISDEQVRSARVRRAAGATLTALAKEYGVSKGGLSLALKRRAG